MSIISIVSIRPYQPKGARHGKQKCVISGTKYILIPEDTYFPNLAHMIPSKEVMPHIECMS